MLEGEPLAGGVQWQHQARALQARQGGRELRLGHTRDRGQKIAGELAPDRGRHLRHLLGLAQAVETGGQGVLDGGWDDHALRGLGGRRGRRRRALCFEQHLGQFLDEQRDAIGGDQDLLAQLGVERAALGDEVDDLGTLLATQTLEGQPVEGVRVEQVRPCIRANGNQGQQRRLVEPSQHAAQPVPGCRIGPLQILEDQWPPAARPPCSERR